MEQYNSENDTKAHIEQVKCMIETVVLKLLNRASEHDSSKLSAVEKPVFDKVTPKLKELTYGSDEYKAQLVEMKIALDHHYSENRHHPEHFENGINGMTLIDLIEMFCDWHAAARRHNDGSIRESILINQKRFGYSDDLKNILMNTATAYMFSEL